MSFMNRKRAFARDAALMEQRMGVIPSLAMDYLPIEYKSDFRLAADAQPALVTTSSAGIPQWLTSYVDPDVIRVFQTPNKAAQIFPETKKGDWTMQTAFFPVVENTGEVSSYGDFNDNALSGANASFEERESYLFQTHIIYGDLEVERAGLARLSWVSELQVSAAKTLDKFQDYTYHFGVAGLRCYGMLNDPSLSPALTPSVKAAGGTKWVTNGQATATPNEVYNDILALFQELVGVQAIGLVDEDTKLKLVLPNAVAVGLGATNNFGLTFRKALSEFLPNVEIITDPRYTTTAGNIVQLIASEIDGKAAGYCGFNEKQRDHRLVPDTSSFKQKKTAGSWGCILRFPLAVATMIGV